MAALCTAARPSKGSRGGSELFSLGEGVMFRERKCGCLRRWQGLTRGGAFCVLHNATALAPTVAKCVAWCCLFLPIINANVKTVLWLSPPRKINIFFSSYHWEQKLLQNKHTLGVILHAIRKAPPNQDALELFQKSSFHLFADFTCLLLSHNYTLLVKRSLWIQNDSWNL